MAVPCERLYWVIAFVSSRLMTPFPVHPSMKAIDSGRCPRDRISLSAAVSMPRSRMIEIE